MSELIFATNNAHKLFEIKNLLKDSSFEIKGLNECGINEEIPEDNDTLEENAMQKARHIFKRTGEDCFADDTGLEISALNGEPGVYSARYSRIGKPVYPEMEATEGNIKKVLEKLDGVNDRSAQFRTVIALILDGREFRFEGIVKGHIGRHLHGDEGFGYDPIFIPEGMEQTFAELPVSEKNKISHRARAMRKLVDFLQNV